VCGSCVERRILTIHKHEDGSIWALWKVIEAHHVQRDASLRHKAWMQLLSIRKSPDEKYLDFYSRVDNDRCKIDLVTPSPLTSEDCVDELALFIILAALPVDDHRRTLPSPTPTRHF
jgi:hypothetical protein